MEKINIEWLNRIDEVFQKQSRHVDSYRKDRRCSKSVMIDRYFKFLDGKFYILCINGEVYYAMFNKIKHTITSNNEKHSYYSYGVSFALGYNNHEFIISFIDEKLKSRDFKLHWNDIIKIEYEEISMDKYMEITRLFIK